MMSSNEILENLLDFKTNNKLIRSQILSKLLKSVLPLVISSVNKATPNKNYSNFWRNYIILNLFSSLIKTSYSNDLADEISKLSKNEFDLFIDNLINLKPFTKAMLLTLNK
jgi:hypothetical protein